ncbi:MAG: DUF2339 domain-containing protein [Candidatus Paceibacterota bacterium]|jgi:uncharacterized membrane protein
MDPITFIVFIVLIVFLFILNSRISNIERVIDERSNENPGFIVKTEGDQLPSVEGKITSMAEVFPLSNKENSSLNSGSSFSDWIRENWIMKLGALLLLLGFGWLTTYAFMNNWIGSEGRIALGIIAGTIFLIVGAWRIEKYQNQGDVFLVLGSTTILLTTFAARIYYDFFGPVVALLLMFMSVVFVAFIGVKNKSKYLPLVSLILAGIAPLLTHSTSVDYIGLFTYLLVVVLGVVWVVAITGQRSLTATSLLLVFFYSLPQFFSNNSELLLFAYLFTIIFFVTNIISIIKSETKDIGANMLTAGMSGIFLLAWVLSCEQEELKSLIIAAWMLAFAVAAFLVFKKTGRKEPFYIYALASTTMLAAATALELNGNVLLIAYAIESVIVPLSIYLIMKEIAIAEAFTFLLIGPAVMSLGAIFSYASQSDPFSREFFSLIIVTSALFGSGLFFWNKAKEINNKECTQVNDFWVILGSGYLYLIIWIFFNKVFDGLDFAVTLSLIIYTLVALSVYFYGMWNDRKGFRIYGQSLLGLVFLRLLFVDIFNMEIAGRIVTLFLIGTLLISTAFLEKRRPKINN